MNKSKTSLSLSAGDWTIIVGLFLVVVTSIYWLHELFGFVISKENNAAIFIGAVALAASAYSTISANRIKKLEINRGFDAARSIVLTDVTEALSESQDILEGVVAINDTNREGWNDLIEQVEVLEDRYVRRQDHVVFLSTHFTSSEFLAVQSIYLKILKLFRLARGKSVNTAIPQQDVPASIIRLKGEMCSDYAALQKNLLGDIQELNIGEIPADLYKRLTRPINSDNL